MVWNWYHFVAIVILHQPRPTDSDDINTRLQISDTSSIPPIHGGFLLVSITHYKRPYDAHMARNRSALDSVLASGVSNRDNTVYFHSTIKPYYSIYQWDGLAFKICGICFIIVEMCFIVSQIADWKLLIQILGTPSTYMYVEKVSHENVYNMGCLFQIFLKKKWFTNKPS